MNLSALLVQLLLLLLLAPLVSGCIKNWKAKLQNRRAPRVWQLCLDVMKFLRKDMVISEHASWVLSVAPYVVFITSLRTECQRMMLRHFFQVSKTMPLEQGRRYLFWVKEKAFLPNYGMNDHRSSTRVGARSFFEGFGYQRRSMMCYLNKNSIDYIMKLFPRTTRLFVAALLAFPLAGFAEEAALMEPVKSVYEHYIAIQTDLAKDSVKGVDEHANAIAKAVKGGDLKMLSADLGKQAETLAKAKDLKGARAAFKPLSASLVKYLADNKAGKGTYHEAYCPMVKASWLQKGTDIKNPYMGKEMLTCGTLKN